MTPVPLRAATAPDKPFAALLAEQQRALLEAFDHQAASLADIVNALGMPRDRSRLPLVEVIFNFSSYFAHLGLPGCEVSTHENPRRAVYYDQFFNVIEADGRLVIDWDYCSDLFDAATMSRWTFRTAMRAMCGLTLRRWPRPGSARPCGSRRAPP